MKIVRLEIVLQRTGDHFGQYVLLVEGTREYRLPSNIESIPQLITLLNEGAHTKDGELVIINTIPRERIIKRKGKNAILEIPVREKDLSRIFKNLKP